MKKRFFYAILSLLLAVSIAGSGVTVYAQSDEGLVSETAAEEDTGSETETADADETCSDTSETPDGYTLGSAESDVEDTALPYDYNDINEDIVQSADTSGDTGTTKISTLGVSINTKKVTIYGIDSWEEDLGYSIPSGFATTYQLKVTGASSVTYKVTSGDCVTVSSTGLIEPVYETWYWTGSYGTTSKLSSYNYKTTEGEYGTATIKVTADSTTFTVKVNFVDYGTYYAEKVMEEYIEENITSSMSTYEKVDAIAAFVAENYNYSSSYSSAKGMILSGGGDCWASTSVILEMCELLGLEAWSRNGNRDAGAGSGHMNALVKDPDKSSTYYEAEAGYTGTAPRYYYVKTRTSLFSYTTYYDDDGESAGIEVYQYDGQESASGTLKVPSKIDGKKVVSIGEKFIYSEGWDAVSLPSTILNISDQAFYYCSSLTSITIPASVISIGDSVFSGCTSLKKFIVKSGNTAFTTSDGVLYSADKTTLVAYPVGKAVTSFTVPDGVKTIQAGAFSGSSKLEKVTLASSVTTLGDNAFYYSKSLTSVSLKKGLKTIGEGAFYYCTGLTSVSIPSTVTTIGQYAFAWCDGLTKMVIPSKVTSIDDAAFCRTGFTYVTFKGNAPEFGETVFYKVSCTVYYPCGNSTWTSGVRNASYGETSLTWKKNHSYSSAKFSGSKVKGTCTGCGNSIEQTVSITLSTSTYTYNGSAKKPSVKIRIGGTTLTSGTHYTVSYSNNTSAGTATVKITGTGTYSGTLKKTFKIKARSLSSYGTAALSTTKYTYSGSVKKPSVTVKAKLSSTKTKTLTKGTDYTVTYASGRKSIGKYKVTIKGTGNYTGTITKYFKISPKKVSISSSTKSSAKKKLTVKWTKSSGGVYYQIAYRKKGSSTWSYKKVKSTSATSYTLTGLSSGKYYYVKVRAYKTVNGTTYHGSWSSTKKVKVK